MSARFAGLQRELGRVLDLDVPGGTVPHVLVLMPSFSIGETTFQHYADQIPALEHRYLTCLPLLERVPSAEIVFLSTEEPGADVLDYHVSLVSPEARDDVRSRLHLVPVPDPSPRPLAPKLLDRPDLIEEVRRLVGGRPAYVEPWNVTDAEMEVAARLGLPVHGTTPDLWPLGFKSAGRRLFREAGVPVPPGSEDVRSLDDVRGAVDALLRAHPGLRSAVIKHDNAGAGEGNARLDLTDPLEPQLTALPDWYVADLRAGGIVEAYVEGDEFASPSAQIDIVPDGDVVVRATHEQLLGGDAGQSFVGCRFPARPDYAAELAEHASAFGARVAREGVVGRASIDFAVARDAGAAWQVHALEANLRKGGTTHPYVALRHLAPGHYDAGAGRWVTADGTPRCYTAVDSIADPAWVGIAPRRVVDHLDAAGLGFDRDTGTGPVLYMLSGLARGGRFGLMTIGTTPDHADALQVQVLERLGSLPG